MRNFLCILALFLVAVSAPVASADTTYTLNQTFNLDGGTMSGCAPDNALCTVATATVSGTITTDGNTGILSSTDITGFDLADEFGSFGDEIPSGSASGMWFTGSGLFATSTGLFLTTDSGGGSVTFVEQDGHSIVESTMPICSTSPCTAGSDPALYFLLHPEPSPGDAIGSIAFSGDTIEIAAATPEPSTAILCFIGLVLMIFLRRRARFVASPRDSARRFC